MKTAVYLRVSSEEQRERQTIETQRQFAERYISQRDIAPVAYYADDGVSGTLPFGERPAGRAILSDARGGAIDALYVYKVDRLGRDPLVTLQAATDLANLGILLQSMTETIDNQTPHGRFSLVMLCGVAGYERDNIVERSIEGTNRLAREGAWLGGIVPFGYAVAGSGRLARLVIADEPLPGLDLSEADVVRLIYGLSAEDRWSCQRIADRLNELGIPTVYVRDERTVQRGKRQQRTSGLWRAGRVRNLITNTTYKGVHRYGKRAAKPREVIERVVPSIVDAETWDAAQQTLRRNMLFSPRNAKRRYLLRGMMRCGLCGLTYCGEGWTTVTGEQKTFYTCTGHKQARGLYGRDGQRCPSKSISGRIEDLVWADIEGFLRDPGDVIRQLEAGASDSDAETDRLRREVAGIEWSLDDLGRQRDLVVGLLRRGRIDAAALDRQLDQIDAEEGELRTDLERTRALAAQAGETVTRLRTAEDVLRDLNHRLDQPMTWELKRQLVETLVAGIRVDTVDDGAKAVPVAEVTYAFARTTTRTGKGSSRRSTQKRDNCPPAAPFEFVVSLPGERGAA